MSGGRGSSNMWEKYFVKQSNDLSKCTLCDKSISTKGRTTKGLSVHLKSIHKIDPKESSQNLEAASSQSSSGPPEAVVSGSGSVNESTTSSTIKKRKITDFFLKENSMEQMVARMVAQDGIPFSIFCASQDLR